MIIQNSEFYGDCAVSLYVEQAGSGLLIGMKTPDGSENVWATWTAAEALEIRDAIDARLGF